MKKYLVIIKAFWQRALVYRFSVLTYRAGDTVEILVLILMWSAIYQAGQNNFAGFTLPEMLTYILIGNLFQNLTRNYLPDVIARDIREGVLSNFLVKPMSYFAYMVAREVGRISLTVITGVISQAVVVAFFLNILIWNLDPLRLILIGFIILLAFFTELLLSYAIGLIAFWTDEVDGIYATVERVKRFFSGGYFPLSLLPQALVQASFFLPFAYTFYIPAQIYLNKIDLAAGARGLLIQSIWILLLYFIIKVVWRRGLKKYEGRGI